MNTKLGLAAAGALGLALTASADQLWRVHDGVVSIGISSQFVRDLGCTLRLSEAVPPQQDMPDATGFRISRASDMTFLTKQSSFRGWKSGHVVGQGGFEISSRSGKLCTLGFGIKYFETASNDNLFVTSAGSDGQILFDLSYIKVNFDPKTHVITAGYADMVLSHKGAQVLGRPDLAGQLLAMITFQGHAEFVAGDRNDPPPAPSGSPLDTGNGDVMLWTLGGCAQATSPTGRLGTYPNGISGCGVGTTSCNVSNITGDNANWYQQMDERHPVIAQNIYRIQTVNGGTRFEQIGIGWVKHGFLSTNSNGCGTCQNPGTGNLLGVHCSDTYGSGLNASQTYLGPRNEINPFTGRWTCRGSYFSGYQQDCISRYSTGGLNGVDHRLQVRDQDLLAPNSTFAYEAYYVSANDTDRYNNIAWRTTVPSWTGSAWTFSSGSSQIQGPAINGWGDSRSTAQPQTEGDAILAVKTTDLGGGMTHYEYALYIHTLDREIRQFSVPVPDGLNVLNISFHDVDQDGTNDWTSTYSNNMLTWQTQTYAQNPNANSLKWGTVYNFRFDVNAAPVNSTIDLGLFKPGTLQTLTAASKGPANPFVFPTSLTTPRGIVLAGGLGDLLSSDNSYLTMRPGVVLSSSEAPVQVVLEGTSTATSPTSLKFRLESAADQANVGQTLELFNFTTSQYDVVDTRNLPTSDASFDATASSPTPYIETGTGTVRTRISCKAVGPILSYPWTVNFDQAVWIIN